MTRRTAKKTFEVARETGNELIVQVKNNQSGLLRRLEHIAATTAPIAVHDSRDLGRNRQEDRRVEVYAPGSSLDGGDWEATIAAVVRVTRQTLIRSAATGLWTSREDTAVVLFRETSNEKLLQCNDFPGNNHAHVATPRCLPPCSRTAIA